MSVLCWIAAAGVAMSALALVGSDSAFTFPIGGLLAYGFAGQVDIPVLVPFAAGNFIYIALADLLLEITTSPHRAAKGPAYRLLRGRAFASYG